MIIRGLTTSILACAGVILAARGVLPTHDGDAEVAGPAQTHKALANNNSSAIPARVIVALSPVYTVDREFRSMSGPFHIQTLVFPKHDPPELLWITGYSTEVVAADGKSPMPQDFMCHANLDFHAQRHSQLFELPVSQTGRLFTLSQGQQEIHLPAGFGLPFYSDEPLTLTTQVLNLNFDGKTQQVRHRVVIEYVLDRDLSESMKALQMTAGFGLVLLDGEQGYYEEKKPQDSQHGPGCLLGEAAAEGTYKDSFGREFSGHWVVKPGKEVNRTLITHLIKLPYDTTLHYAAVHLHPFAKSLLLRDLTTGETVYESKAEGFDDRIGLSRVEYLSSPKGIPMFASHDYELVSTYLNTTMKNQDSMAVLLMYLLDKEFDKRPRTLPYLLSVNQPTPHGEEAALLHTSLGDIKLALYETVAPRHVQQFKRLVRLKVYDTMRFPRIEPGFLIQTGYPHYRGGKPLTAEQDAAIRPLKAEFNDLPQRRGVAIMLLDDDKDPHSAKATFGILLGDAPHLYGRYTIFGEVLEGFETLDRIAAVPRSESNVPLAPVEIERATIIRAKDSERTSTTTQPGG